MSPARKNQTTLKLLVNFMLLLLPLMVWSQDDIHETDRIIDSLCTSLKPTQNDTLQIKTLNRIASGYNRIGNYKQAIQWALQAQLLAKKRNYGRALPVSYNIIGNAYANTGNQKVALQYYFLSAEVNKNMGDRGALAYAYNEISSIYKGQENYEKAMEYYVEALKIMEETKNKSRAEKKRGLKTGKTFLQEEIYNADYKKELDDILRSIANNKNKFNDGHLASSYNSAGMACYKIGYFSESFDYYLKALKIYQKTKNLSGIAYSLYYIGLLYSAQGNYNTHKNYHLQDLKAKNYNIATLGAKSHLKKSNLKEQTYLNLDTLEKAFVVFNQSLEASTKIENYVLVKDTYAELVDLTRKLNDYQLAYRYQKLYSIIHDTLYTGNLNEEVTLMGFKYETALKGKKIQLLTKDMEMKEMKMLITKSLFKFYLIIIL